MMKRCIALAMSAALALSITACGSSSMPRASQSGSASDASTVLGEDVQIPNPWKDFESLEEAVKAVGFDFVAPDALAGCDQIAYQAIPDDRIIGVLYLNGEAVDEPYIDHPPTYEMAEYTVPEGMYFVLGDNRANSNDSHLIGPIEQIQVVGHARLVIFPFDSIRALP